MQRLLCTKKRHNECLGLNQSAQAWQNSPSWAEDARRRGDHASVVALSIPVFDNGFLLSCLLGGDSLAHHNCGNKVVIGFVTLLSPQVLLSSHANMQVN